VSDAEDPVRRPSAEGGRLAALHALRILDTPAEERFDRITRVAAQLFAAPIALISLIDADRHWSKSCFGVGELEMPRASSFCAHELGRLDVFAVADATQDARFACNPFVAGPPAIRFYAGAVIRSACGQAIGRLCVIDDVARDPAAQPLAVLTDLAAWVELELHGGAAPAPAGDPATLALMQERFMTVAAHELRTPLTLLRGYSEELLDPHAGDLSAEQRVAAMAIDRGARRLQALIDDVLLVLELDAGRVRLDRCCVEAQQLMGGVREQLAAEARRADVDVELDVAAGVQVVGDPRRLAVALAALLRNAIAWSPAEGTIRMTATDDGGELRLTVSDAGPGLPVGEGVVLGRRFRRLRGLDPREGAGLGLAIAHGLAELHAGRLEADGAIHSGAAVSIVLPTAARA
jgi:signal transduction histidine kinase